MCPLSHHKPAEAVEGRLCDHHVSLIRETLQDILELWALLPLYVLPGSVADLGGGKPPKKRQEAPTPLRLEVAALNDWRTDDEEQAVSEYTHGSKLESNGAERIPTADMLRKWVSYLRGARGMVRRRRPVFGPVCRRSPCGHGSCALIRRRDAETVAEQVRLLQTNVVWFAGDRAVETFYSELRTLRKFLALAQGEQAVRPHTCYMLVERPEGDGGKVVLVECGGLVWPIRKGDGAKCNSCGKTWRGLEMVRLTAVAQAESA